MATSAPSRALCAFSGRCGHATVQSISSRFSSIVRVYSASGSASTAVHGRLTRPATYARVTSSTGKMPFFAPASMAMFEIVSRS